MQECLNFGYHGNMKSTARSWNTFKREHKSFPYCRRRNATLQNADHSSSPANSGPVYLRKQGSFQDSLLCGVQVHIRTFG